MSIVRVTRRGPVRHVELDCGPRNVLTTAAIDALRGALVEDAEAPVAVLSGRADGFSAGLDGAVLAGDASEREALLAAMGELLHDVLVGTTRIVALCRGHAVAAGAMLLLVSDVRIGTGGEYKVGFTEPRMGMPLPELPLLLASERLDRRRLHALTALGEVVGPEEARRVGFLDEVVDASEAEERAFDRARSLAGLSAVAYRESLRGLWGPTLGRIESLVDAQRRRASEAAR